MADPDLQIRVERGGGGGGGGGACHPDLHLEIRGTVSKKTFFRPFGPQFGLNIRGAGPRAPPLDPPVLMFVAHLQIDSQVPDATFQTALYPVPPPKSLAAENGKGRL